jgi:phage-related protein (TIGR01555 family)
VALVFKNILVKMLRWALSEKKIIEEKPKKKFFDKMTLKTDMTASEALEFMRVCSFQEKKLNIFYGQTDGEVVAMDAATPAYDFEGANGRFAISGIISPSQIAWYGSQSFIGYQLCAALTQNWLIEKCCSMPAEDATSKGYEVTVNDGTKIDKKIQDAIRQADIRLELMKSLTSFVTKGRMYGIRVAYFDIATNNSDEYYSKPFNPDGIKPGSYKGIIQVDPFWIVGLLSSESAANPGSRHFYEPTWWQIGGRKIHYTHVIIYRCGELADTLKPTYLWGSVSIPQKLYDRVYCAERTANEAPLLALTKRTEVYKTDLSEAIAQGPAFIARMQENTALRNNYGTRVIDESEEIQQHDVSLTDLDAVIMTQYQLVAAIAEIPATKLMGTQPKGFNTTGEYEESSYHQKLQAIQRHDLTPLLARHYEILIRSEIAPKFGVQPFNVTIVWNSLDAMTAKEQAEVNDIKATSDEKLARAMALSGDNIRDRLISDPQSGYSGITSGAPEPIEENDDLGEGDDANTFN